MNHPLMYQLNTRVLLQERSAQLGRPATLDDFTDGFVDDIAAKGFEWVWCLGVWQTGQAGLDVSRSHSNLREELHKTLPDLRERARRSRSASTCWPRRTSRTTRCGSWRTTTSSDMPGWGHHVFDVRPG